MEEAKNKAGRGQVLEAASEAATEIGEATGNESLLGTGETVGKMIGAAQDNDIEDFVDAASDL